MFLSFARAVRIASLCAVCLSQLAAEKWTIQFFYDKDKSHFQIVDLQFPSAKRGVAFGVIEEGKHRDGMSYVTSDGGATWNPIALKELPVSGFFLNESLGWMVTAKGIWYTEEAGRSWKKLPNPPSPVVRLYFLNEKDGWAVGGKKLVFETHDGGQKWKPLAIAANQPGAAANSAYTWVSFATSGYGVISGWNIPPRRFMPRWPSWMDPEGTLRVRETPHLSYILSTQDGGKTWHPSSSSLFGTVSKIRLGPKGTGVGLVQYGEGFRYPSEAYAINWTNGTNRSIFRDPKFAISDVWMTQDGTIYLSGMQVQGQLRGLIPGKVRVLSSTDQQSWKIMDVDYRAEALGTVMAAPDSENIWLATDTGMILKLQR